MRLIKSVPQCECCDGCRARHWGYQDVQVVGPQVVSRSTGGGA